MKAAKKKPMRGPDSPLRGPEPDRRKLNGNWQAAIKKSLQKKRPGTGWHFIRFLAQNLSGA
jgi:hypothetical protein